MPVQRQAVTSAHGSIRWPYVTVSHYGEIFLRKCPTLHGRHFRASSIHEANDTVPESHVRALSNGVSYVSYNLELVECGRADPYMIHVT